MLNNQQAIQRVQKTFLHPYNDENYKNFISDLLNNLQTNDNFEKQIKNDDHIESYKKIGFYEDNNGDIIDILSVKVKNGTILERTRTRLRDFTVNHIRNSPTDPDGCLVAFYADEFKDWRFSFVKMSYKVVEDIKTGRIKTKEEISEPKRYSFLIGSDEPSFTAQKQMIPLLQSSEIVFEDIVDAFSTERVTNEFYQAYRGLFEDLTLSLVQIRENDPRVKENFKKEFIKEDDFAKKLLGQIVFVYFIQRKGWLGIKRDIDGNFGNWGSGDKKFIRNLFNKKYCQYNNFFNDVLEHLFYNGLGTENSDNYFSLLDCKIPFLNGGIFEPLNNYNWQETDIIIENKTIEEILDVFDRYNFTVREESDLDVDVAVDPEMLGRVFENLLPENMRKGKGAYYTPRTVVNYMCQESIINYLDSETAEYIDLDTIQDFIKRNNVEKLSKHNAELLDSLLSDIKICDPAIGSGAFAMGLLNVIVKSRSILCSLTGEKIDKYDLKRYAIINSIFGVDLDPGAVEIAKLRLFLSLIVDEKDFDFIEPLPNLDFQIMQGNSLIEEFYGITLDINKKTVQGEIFEDVNKIDELISNLHQAQTMFSNESNYKRKRELKNKVENCIIDIFKFKYHEKKKYISDIDLKQMDKDLEDIVHGKNPRNFFPWKLYFADIFRSKGGFDIMIANPPYIGQKGNSHIFKPIRNTGLSKFFTGRVDLFYFFFHMCINLGKDGSIINFITTNYFTSATFAQKLRKDIKNRTQIISMINFNELKIFESALGQHNMITMLKKSKEKTILSDNIICSLKGHANTQTFHSIFKKKSKEVNYFKIKQNEIFDGPDNYIRLSGISDSNNIENKILNKISSNPTLDEICYVRTGLRTGIDRITNSHIKKYGNIYVKDSGVFVLSELEYLALNLNDYEKDLVKKLYKNSDIRKYYCKEHSKYHVLYIPKKTLDNNETKIRMPNVYNHLLKYKIILKDRRNEWLNIDRNREEFIFKSNKIVAPQRSYLNTFGYNEIDWYASADVYYIIQKNKDFNLKYILALLNSKLYYLWLLNKGKRKGDMLELYQKPLSEIPIKKITLENQKPYINLVDQIFDSKASNPQQNTTTLESEIDKLVYELYGLTEEEIQAVESSID